MKKLRRLSLAQQAKVDLSKREMNELFGGGTPGCCVCGCAYSGTPNGSSTVGNSNANNTYGYSSPGGGIGGILKGG